jgi:endonuclease/exonuclease/phosphatase family metal-dependent hydrolase
LKTACDMAAQDAHPVVFAGDLNLVGLSPLWRGCLSGFRDGFAEAGSGFGYTFPNGKAVPPWMRLDHILVSEHLRFDDFDVIEETRSDHLCVMADIVPK